MKRIVDGRLYDTGNAVIVCSWQKTVPVCGLDVKVTFALCREKVYKDPKALKVTDWGGVSDWDAGADPAQGRFFLATQVGETYDTVGRIEPLDADEAKRIYEANATSEYSLEDNYATFFGIRPQKADSAILKEAFEAGVKAAREAEEEKRKAEAAREAEEEKRKAEAAEETV